MSILKFKVQSRYSMGELVPASASLGLSFPHLVFLHRDVGAHC